MSLRFVLIGHPVAHSLSPAIHGAAYRELGLDHRYELVDAPDEERVRSVIDELRRGEIAGINVTIPWKRSALALADKQSPGAHRIGAANVLERAADGQIIAHNTDVMALVEEFRRHVRALDRAVLIGSGGAAQAVIVACQECGARQVGITSRRWSAELDSSAWPNAAQFRALGAELLAWPDSSETARRDWQAFVLESQLVVQASSAGMHGADPGEPIAALVPFEKLAPGTLAYDLVYTPPNTPFVEAAHKAGLTSEHGLSMLVGQAALSIEIWLGLVPPREPLFRAAERALAARGRS